MENQAPFNERVWYPRINNTVMITVKGKDEKGNEKDLELLGTFEGVLAIERTIPPSLPDEGLVRFIANLYDQHKEFSAVISNCINPNSKISRLCVVPMSAIMEPNNDRSKKQVDKGVGKRTK
jgi:hypothetical protein